MELYDKIHIRDLQVRCIIGIQPEERREKQDILINITLFTNIEMAGKSDDINDTLDYKMVKKEILKFVENSSFFLIEKLAEEVAKICLSHEKVKGVTVTIDKPGVLRFARSVAVEITRMKK
ncbi:MAG TPA: dihydroneopterin aldolase [Candidatus Hydrogenedens sp.]|nr:dihydroneopterin aldolase [Candidatus Hydrogenedens sp.]HOK08624.1 dihydroneopterin aldolase [Candidatus Hydrogenedens sp.]HPP58335.1 dihydroneopterin aldolase [Candidatus Hydrogenedens sp.]